MKIQTQAVGPIATNCHIISDETTGDAAIIDPGGGAKLILRKLEGLKARQILLTHGHFDHILAVRELREALNIPVAIHRLDADCLTNPAKSLSAAAQSQGEADSLLEDGDVITCGSLEFQVIHTPGHTKGSVVFKSGSALFTGDTLFMGGCGRCDFPGGNYGEMLRSMRKLYELQGDYEVYPGHGDSTTLDFERRHNFAMLEATEL